MQKSSLDGGTTGTSFISALSCCCAWPAFEKVLSRDKELVVILHGVPTTKAVGGRSVSSFRFQLFCKKIEALWWRQSSSTPLC